MTALHAICDVIGVGVALWGLAIVAARWQGTGGQPVISAGRGGMVVDHYVVKTNAGLAAADERTEEYLRTFGIGEVIAVAFKRPRNIRHHRLFFALLNTIFQNQDVYLSVEGLRFALIIAAGYAEEIKVGPDKVTLKPRSLSFSSMTQDDFNDFYRAALAAVPRLLPQYEGVDIEALLPRSPR